MNIPQISRLGPFFGCIIAESSLICGGFVPDSAELPKPLVTIVIPCYNYAPVVGRAIDSVRGQTITNFECFVVDDGSTDDSADAIKRAIAGDRRFHYVHQPNAGVAEARNAGVFAGTGKYVACLDADDQIASQYLEACVGALESDPSIDIAYTGLWYVKPDGSEGLSPWPRQCDYDKALVGLNQIPTANVSRRRVWERLGGQRQRYCPLGAGEEDAEMWLRAGAYGFRAKKVTDAGLFIYSWLSGRVSGNKQHQMTDYRAWHPWTKDGKHPFMSVATPEKFSHAVRQYDQPFVSVIIPVGNGHERYVETALDSLEAQTFRNWEVIVVRDGDQDQDVFERVMRAYPYARRIDSGNVHGAGWARNRGVEIARGPLLLYLDADDWLHPEAIDKLLAEWNRNQAIIYSDYIGKAMIAPKALSKFQDRLLHYDEKYGIATLYSTTKDYDCPRAQAQPDVDMYIWSLVTCLIPREWHDEIGGFDEDMVTWEDWDYSIRMARAGHCFVRVQEPLVVYRFYSGQRREEALADNAAAASKLFAYLKEKYEGTKTMPCSSCGGRRSQSTVPPGAVRSGLVPAAQRLEYDDQQYRLIMYNHPSLGQARVVGAATSTDYGYRGRGERFLVHVDDIRLQPSLFVIVDDVSQPQSDAKRVESASDTESQPEPESRVAPPPPPPMVSRFHLRLHDVPGITSYMEQELNAMGVYEVSDLIENTPRDLTSIKGIGPARARQILQFAKDHAGSY